MTNQAPDRLRFSCAEYEAESIMSLRNEPTLRLNVKVYLDRAVSHFELISDA